MVRGLLLGACALLACPSLASAQTAVLFPVGGDAELASAHGAEAVERVQRDFEESSFTVLTGDALAQAMTAAQAEECADPSCAGPMLTALHADLAVGVALWRRNGLVQVSVVLVDPHGVLVSADADGAETVIGQATQSALSQARARWATRGGSPVRVVGTPEGATITVDREPWGTLPHEGSLAPGTHHFVVSADGHVTERRDVEIAAATETIEVSFELPVGADTEPVTPPPPGGGISGAGIGMIVAGAVLAAAGIGGLAYGTASISSTPSCVSGCAGPVADRVISRPDVGADAAWIAVGGAGLIAGAVLILIGASTTDGPRAGVSVGPNGLSLRF